MGESGDRMPKVDVQNQKINPTQLQFMKLIEKQNLERVQKLQRLRRNNIITGCIVGTGVFSIYFYSMWAVQQEKFLDDFNEPEKTTSL